MTLRDDAERTIQSVEKLRYEAILKPDLETLDEIFHDRLIYTHSSGTIDTKASYLNAIRDGRLNYHEAHSQFQNLLPVHDGMFESVVVTSRARLLVEVENELKSLDNQTTGVWLFDSGRYRLLAFSATPIQS